MQFSSNLLALALLVVSITAVPIAAEADSGLVSVTDTAAEVPTTTDSQPTNIDQPFLPDFEGTVPNVVDVNALEQRDAEANRRPQDDGKWYEGKYEGHGTPYDNGKWYPGKYEKRDQKDNGKWYPGKYEGYPTAYDNGKWYSGKYNKREAEAEANRRPQDDGKWYQGKYEGYGTGYDNGKYYG
jgi:hypothetical protein